MSTNLGEGSTGAATTPPPAASAPPTGTPTAPEPWYASEGLGFDQEAKDYLGSKNFQSPADLLKSTRHFETLSRDRNVMAKPVAGKEGEWDGWKELGWESDPTKYKIDPPKDIKPDHFDAGFHDALSKALHGAKVPASLGKSVIDGVASHISQQLEAIKTETAIQEKEMMDALHSEWGSGFAAKREMASRAMKAFEVDPADANQLEAVIGSAGLVKLFQRIGDMMGEDRLVLAGGGNRGAAQSAGSARAERLQLQSDPDFMKSLTDARHPLHAINKAKRDALLSKEVA